MQRVYLYGGAKAHLVGLLSDRAALCGTMLHPKASWYGQVDLFERGIATALPLCKVCQHRSETP